MPSPGGGCRWSCSPRPCGARSRARAYPGSARSARGYTDAASRRSLHCPRHSRGEGNVPSSTPHGRSAAAIGARAGEFGWPPGVLRDASIGSATPRIGTRCRCGTQASITAFRVTLAQLLPACRFATPFAVQIARAAMGQCCAATSNRRRVPAHGWRSPGTSRTEPLQHHPLGRDAHRLLGPLPSCLELQDVVLEWIGGG